MAKEKKECECGTVTVNYAVHKMSLKKLTLRPAEIVCVDCGKKTQCKAVGFTLNVKGEDGEDQQKT